MNVPPSDPRWKIRNVLKVFIREHFEDKFFIVEDLHWGYFTFVIKSNYQTDVYVKEVDREALQQKLERMLKHEKIALEKVKVQYLKSDDPKYPQDDFVLRFDILE